VRQNGVFNDQKPKLGAFLRQLQPPILRKEGLRH